MSYHGPSRIVFSTDYSPFYLDFGNFIPLVEESYEVLQRKDTNFCNYVSFGVYYYYNIVMFWLRLFQIEKKNLDTNTFNIFSNILPAIPPITTEIKMYLDAIGNIYGGASQIWYLKTQATLSSDYGLIGHYGKVEALSHLVYETLPSPYIAILAMVKDKDFTINHNTSDIWDLPSDLSPSTNSNKWYPTKNLLGWRPAKHLTENQLKSYEQNGEGDIQDNLSFPIKLDLIQFVAKKMSDSNIINIDSLNNVSTSGSPTIIPLTTRVFDDITDDRSMLAVEKMGLMKSCRMYLYMDNSGKEELFRFRFKRYCYDAIPDFLCYSVERSETWTFETDPFREWILNSNDIVEWPAEWNVIEFHLGQPGYGRGLLREFCHGIQN